MATTTTSTFGALFQSIINAVKGDIIKDALPVLNNFFQSITSNPSQANIIAQALALQVNLLAALPNLESDVAKDIAQILQAEFAQLTAAQTAAPTAGTATAAKAA